jgi:multidrug efflux pump subunit AcrB
MDQPEDIKILPGMAGKATRAVALPEMKDQPGIGAFFSLGQLEDPEFTVKTAVVTTLYPGAGPKEVELEVTDRIELAIQEMPQIDYLESFSRAGMSLISVNIKQEYWSDRLPQVWDELRRKIRNIEEMLPPGAGRPDISDDFGDVFGFQLAVVGDGYSYADLEQYAKDIKKEISLVDGVARVDLWGVQNKVIYVNASQSQLSELGLTDASVQATLSQQNMVVDAGSLDLQRMSLGALVIALGMMVDNAIVVADGIVVRM